MLITTKKWAKRPLQNYLVEYRFHPLVNQRVNFNGSSTRCSKRCFRGSIVAQDVTSGNGSMRCSGCCFRDQSLIKTLLPGNGPIVAQVCSRVALARVRDLSNDMGTRHHRLPRKHYQGRVSAAFTLCLQDRRSFFVDPAIVQVFVEFLRQVADGNTFWVIYCFMPDHAHLIFMG